MYSYKIFVHAGPELGLKTRVEKGVALLSSTELTIQNGSTLSISLSKITSAKLFRLHGLGRVIQIDHQDGRLFLSVIRFMIGQFATINFLKTGQLHKQIEASITKSSEV